MVAVYPLWYRQSLRSAGVTLPQRYYGLLRLPALPSVSPLFLQLVRDCPDLLGSNAPMCEESAGSPKFPAYPCHALPRSKTPAAMEWAYLSYLIAHPIAVFLYMNQVDRCACTFRGSIPSTLRLAAWHVPHPLLRALRCRYARRGWYHPGGWPLNESDFLPVGRQVTDWIRGA